MFNGLYYNPAYAGADNTTRFSTTQRTQYYGYTPTNPRDNIGAQNTQLLTFSMPMSTLFQSMKNMGVGIHIANDKIGPVKSTEFQASYSYHINIGESKLSFGFRYGTFFRSLNYDILVPFEKESTIPTGSIKDNNFDLGLGAWYTASNFYAGISMARLNQATFNLGAKNTYQLRRTTYLTGGYTLDINENIKVTPSVLITTDFKDVSKFDIGGLATYQNVYFAGLNFRSGVASYNNLASGNVTKYTVSDLGIIAGLYFLKDNAMRVAYSFDAVLPNADALAPTSHEISLSYILPVITRTPRIQMRTPRYRK